MGFITPRSGVRASPPLPILRISCPIPRNPWRRMVYTVKLVIDAWRGLSTISVENSEVNCSSAIAEMTTGFYAVGKNNWLKLIGLEHNNEKKSYLVAINACRFGRCISEVHPERNFEFS